MSQLPDITDIPGPHLLLRLDQTLALVLWNAEPSVDNLHHHDGPVEPEGAVEAQAVHEQGVQLGGQEHVEG